VATIATVPTFWIHARSCHHRLIRCHVGSQAAPGFARMQAFRQMTWAQFNNAGFTEVTPASGAAVNLADFRIILLAVTNGCVHLNTLPFSFFILCNRADTPVPQAISSEKLQSQPVYLRPAI
jgi:hypothetical protein